VAAFEPILESESVSRSTGEGGLGVTISSGVCKVALKAGSWRSGEDVFCRPEVADGRGSNGKLLAGRNGVREGGGEEAEES